MIAKEEIGKFYVKEDENIFADKLGLKYFTKVSENESEECSVGEAIPAWFQDEKNFNKALSNSFLEIHPMTAEIIPSLLCPFRCEQCSYRPQKEKMGIWDKKNEGNTAELLMSRETMRNALNSLEAVGTRHIIFTGGGEPLSNKDVLFYGIRKATEKNMEICLYTNALLLTKDAVNELISSSVKVCRISIYGANPEGFTNYTKCQKENYNTIFNNIRNLVIEKVRRNSDLQVSLSFLLHPQMYNNGANISFLDLLKEKIGEEYVKHISSVRFTPAIDYYSDTQIDKDFFEAMFEKVESEKDAALTYGIVFKNYTHRLQDMYGSKKYDRCLACGLYAEIGPDGSMYQCCEKLFLSEYKIGNINEDSIAHIYASNVRKKVVQYVDHNIKSCPSVCKPHEANKQYQNFVEIKDDERALMLLWRYQKLNEQSYINDAFGKFNYFES